MSRSDDRDRGLEHLASSVLRAERPDPELLLRFARDPDSLSDEERVGIEAQLEASPVARDQLELLRRTDVAALVRLSQDGERAGVGWLTALRQNWVRLVLAPVGVAAALALWLLPSGNGIDAPEGPQHAQVDPEPPEPPTTEPPSRPVQDPTPPEGEGEIEPETAPPEREPPMLAEKPTPPEPEGWPIDYLAMADANYRPPIGFEPIEGVDSWVRSPTSKLELAALAPAHIGLTHAESPALYWAVSEKPMDGSLVVFALADAEDGRVISERELPPPARTGIQRLSLAELGVRLETGRDYRWSVVLITDRENPADSLRSDGWIRRVVAADAPPPADLGLQAQRAAVEGRWYDALEAIASAEEQSPAEASRAALRRLLSGQALERFAP